MQRISLIFTLAVMLTFAVAAFGQADQSGENLLPDESGTISPAAAEVADLAMAEEMAAYGRANKSPVTLTAAAEIIASIAVKDEAREKTTEGDEAGDAEKVSPAEAGQPDAQALFAEAAALAKEQNNYALAELIEKQAKASVGTRRRVGGAVRHSDVVRTRATDVYRMTFRGGERAMVSAYSPSRRNLGLAVYDQNNNLLRVSSGYGPLVQWTPRWTGSFTVRIRNNSSGPVGYVLTTN